MILGGSNLQNIILIGFMATGKTTIGEVISKKLNMELVNMDSIIEKEQNTSISNIFSEKGEDYFRDLETKMLKDCVQKKNIILSTGGGIIERECNLELLKKIGTVIWLNGNRKTIIKNLKSSSEERPLLKDQDIEEKVDFLLEKRFNKYKCASDIEVDINNKSVEEVVSIILLNLNKI